MLERCIKNVVYFICIHNGITAVFISEKPYISRLNVSLRSLSPDLHTPLLIGMLNNLLQEEGFR